MPDSRKIVLTPPKFKFLVDVLARLFLDMSLENRRIFARVFIESCGITEEDWSRKP